MQDPSSAGHEHFRAWWEKRLSGFNASADSNQKLNEEESFLKKFCFPPTKSILFHFWRWHLKHTLIEDSYMGRCTQTCTVTHVFLSHPVFSLIFLNTLHLHYMYKMKFKVCFWFFFSFTIYTPVVLDCFWQRMLCLHTDTETGFESCCLWGQKHVKFTRHGSEKLQKIVQILLLLKLVDILPARKTHALIKQSIKLPARMSGCSYSGSESIWRVRGNLQVHICQS